MAVICAVLLSAVACRKPGAADQAIRIEHEISPMPVKTGPALVTLRVKDALGQPVTGAHIALEGNMSHPGMGPQFGEAGETAAGQYQGRLQFTMAGDWVILLHIKLRNGEQLVREVDVRGVRAE